jgi:uncharacterized membrane protein
MPLLPSQLARRAKHLAVATLTLTALGAQAQSAYQYIELKQSGLAAGIYLAKANKINNAGQVTGAITKRTGTQLLIPEFKFAPVYSDLATIWSATGTPAEVPIATAMRQRATYLQGVSDINNSGVVVGFGAASVTAETLPSKWVSNKRTAIDTRRGSASAINDAGVIAGSVTVFIAAGDTRSRATVWRDGQAVALHALLGLPEEANSTAVNINAAGQLVVNSNLGYGTSGPCFVVTGTTVQAMERSADQGCYLKGISDSGVAAGSVYSSSPTSYSEAPAWWQDGRLQLLPTLPQPSNGDYLGPATVLDISKSGIIVGTDQSQAVMWINGQEKIFNAPITGLPAGAKLSKIVSISDNGKLLVEVFGKAGPSFAVLVPKP